MEYKEEEYLMLSGIQHFAFCRRQWALIHLEQQWQENERTVEGELLHQRAHRSDLFEKRKGVLITRAMPVYSKTMGVSGECDIVEFEEDQQGIPLFGHRGHYRVYPIEYKKGKPKETEIDHLQLTAQAMCLEEMLSAKIEEGACYYGEIRHREVVTFTKDLREQVQKYFKEMHDLYYRHYTPKVKWSKSCNACSLKEICLPKLGKTPSIKEYIQSVIGKE